jgi:hypothetical protein
MELFVAVREGKRTLESYDYLNQGLDALFDQLVWWAKALKAAREPARPVLDAMQTAQAR